MDTIIQLLQERLESLERLKSIIESDLKKLPPGARRLSYSHRFVQYYQVIEKKTNIVRRYIPAAKMDLARKLGQKDYLGDLHSVILEEIDEIKRILRKDKLFLSNRVYGNLHPSRKKLVDPYLLDEDEYAELWLKRPFEANPYHPEHLIYQTKRGEMVRSKAEELLADMYFELGVPYKYDAAVYLDNGLVRYIDFILLHKASRKEFYHEHLGRLDNPGYLLSNMQKLDLYRQNGIFTGKNLILTHEIDGSPLNLEAIRKNTRELFGIDE